MSLEEQILESLRDQRPEFASIRASNLEPIQNRAYLLHTHPPYFIKWIPEDDSLGQNEIWVNQTILPGSGLLAPRLVLAVEASGGMVAAWEWLEGKDLRFEQRGRLPQAFVRIGTFHARQRTTQPVRSLITRQAYPSVKELLAAESDFLGAYHARSVRNKIAAAFGLLEVGYPTAVHGDLHPGNIRLTGRGLAFVDWGYAAYSLNLFDLGYIDVEVDECAPSRDWWEITPSEAGDILPAYYDACGLVDLDIDLIQRVVMLWGELWGYHNLVRLDNTADLETCQQRISSLLSVV